RRGTDGDHLVPLAGGSHRQAHAARAGPRTGPALGADEASAGGRRGRNGTQPSRAKREAAGRGENVATGAGEMDFGYATKMDVRNNPIVREIDRSRQRELWRSVAIGVGLVVVVLFSLWQRFAVIRTGTEIERMQHELQEEQVINRQLQLQNAQLSNPGR